MRPLPCTVAAALLAAAVLTSLVLGAGSPTAPLADAARAAGEPPGWTQVTPPESPPAMAGALMAYSPRSDRFVLFGGWNGTTGLNGTWVYDPAHRTWTELHPSPSPPSRGDGMFVYDNRSDVFLLFGGWHETPQQTYVRLGDTWSFSLPNDTWTPLQPALPASPRSDAEVAYDPAADAVLLVGGFNGTAYLGDVWAYFPGDDTWTPRPSAAAPSPRADGRMVYVPGQDRLVLFGGNDYSGPNFTFHHLADSWSYAWDADTWARVPTPIEPPARDYPIFAYDPGALAVLLTGGFGNNTVLSDTWSLDVTTDTWANATPSASAPARFAAAGGFDTADGVLVVFSGAAYDGLLGDTWQYAYGPAPSGAGPVPLLDLLGWGFLAALAVAMAVVVLTPRLRRTRRDPPDPPPGRGI